MDRSAGRPSRSSNSGAAAARAAWDHPRFAARTLHEAERQYRTRWAVEGARVGPAGPLLLRLWRRLRDGGSGRATSWHRVSLPYPGWHSSLGRRPAVLSSLGEVSLSPTQSAQAERMTARFNVATDHHGAVAKPEACGFASSLNPCVGQNPSGPFLAVRSGLLALCFSPAVDVRHVVTKAALEVHLTFSSHAAWG